jgi:hypothetical protein
MVSELMPADPKDVHPDPETVFNHPIDVISDSTLSHAQKTAVLTRWKQNLQDRIRATGEGMNPPAGKTANESDMLETIAKAITALNLQR